MEGPNKKMQAAMQLARQRLRLLEGIVFMGDNDFDELERFLNCAGIEIEGGEDEIQ